MIRAATLSNLLGCDLHNIRLTCDCLDAALSEGRLDIANQTLISAPSDVRADLAVRMREARVLFLGGDFASAVKMLTDLLETLPADGNAVAVYHDLAYAQSCLGDDEAAQETLAGAKLAGVSDVALSLLKVRLLYKHKSYEQALDELASFGAGERAAEVHGLRAVLMLDIGRHDEAFSEAQRGLAIAPDQHDALLVKGTLALQAQTFESAEQTFRHVVAVRPQSARALLGLGESLMATGDIAAARAQIERAAVIMPDHIGTWHALAWCQLMEGDAAGAKHSFERAFALDRTFGETHGGFALIHALRGERSEAEESIKRAKRLAPEGQTARYAQSVLLLDDGHPEEARRMVEGILAHTPGRMPAMSVDFIFRLRDLLRPRG